MMNSLCRIGLLACAITSVIGLPVEQTSAASQFTRFRPYVLAKLQNFTFTGTPPEYGFIPIEDLEASEYANLTTVESSFSIDEDPEDPEDPVTIDGRGVIGGDDRKAIDSTAKPYSAIGRVVWSDGTICTGTLVGERVVLTASHCVPWGNSDISIIFQPDYYDKERFGRASVTMVNAIYMNPINNFDPSPCGIEKDFAILQLDTRLGQKASYMGATTWTSAASTGLIHVGYPVALSGGGRMYYQTNVAANLDGSFACDSVGPLTSLVDTSEGHSGGPLFQPSTGNIVAVFSAGGKNTNAFATGTIPALVAWARTNWA